MDWLQKEHGIRRFVAAGLCGGAVTGLLTAQRDARIEGLIAPVDHAPRLEENRRHLPVHDARAVDLAPAALRAEAGEPEGVAARAELKSDFRTIWRSAAQPFKRRRPASAADPAPANGARRQFQFAVSAGVFRDGRVRAPDAAALRRIRPAPLRVRGEVRQPVRGSALDAVEPVPHSCDPTGEPRLHVRRWQREVVDRASDWLDARFPIRTAPSLATV